MCEVRVVDGSVLKLIKQWLKAPVQEEDEQGRKKIGRNKSGTPQGGVLSPLMANIYCTGLIESSTARRSGPMGQGDVDPVCGRLRDYGAVHEPADSELHRAEIGGMAGAKTQPRQDPDSQSTPEPRALEFLGYQIGFALCQGGPGRHYCA